MQDRLRNLDSTKDYALFVAPGGRNTLPYDLVAQIKDAIPFGVSCAA